MGPNVLESKIISDLKTQIQCLENEKKDLISSLEQLDIDNQQNVDKIIKYKDDLQAELLKTKLDFDNLKKDNDKLKDWSATSDTDAENDELIKRNNDLEQEFSLYKERCESSKIENHKLIEENKLLRQQNEKNRELLEDQTISQDDYKKLECILHEYEKRVRNYELELQELQKSNADYSKNSDSQSLQNIVESSNKIIENKDATIKELEDNNLELKTKLQLCEIEIENYERNEQQNAEIEESRIHNLEQEMLKLNSENVLLKEQFQICNVNLKKYDDLQRRSQELDHTILNSENQIKKMEIDKNIADNKILLLGTENLEQQKLVQDLNVRIQNLMQKQNNDNSFAETIYNTCFDSSGEDFKIDSNSKIDLVRNFITDLKLSQSKLQNEVSQLSDLNQKTNQEIEKLTRNSSTLKQEIVNKNIEFEEFEAEYNELMKSNEVMINELNSLKNNSLITISETNEDNMLQLENDLENANSKIKELEVILDSEKSRPQSNEPFEMLQKSYEEMNVENQDLQRTLDKYKVDFENLDYKSNEHKAQIDSLQEDLINNDKQKIYLEEENNVLSNKLQELSESYQKVCDEFIDHKSKSLQDVKNMREKLQGSKMTETSLKLQNELQSKEIIELKKSTVVADLQQKLDIEIAKHAEAKINLDGVIEQLQGEVKRLKELHKAKNVLELKEISLADQQNDEYQEIEELKEKYDLQSKELEDRKEKYDALDKDLQILNGNHQKLIDAVNSKHQESSKYYQDIQNLQKYLFIETEKCKNYELEICKLKANYESHEGMNKQIEKLTDQNEFLKEKCNKMTETLMNEQSSSKKQLMDANEREQSLSRELERLRQHLLEIEEMYTKELLIAEQKTSEMQSKVNEIEQREKNSNNVYTSVSIRANQQVETLQTQMQLVTNQRDEIRNKLSDNEDQVNKQAAALMNLQCVLQQFQKDKQKDIHNETDRIRRQIAVEKNAQIELQKEISSLKQQLKESKEGLQAAGRLTDQLEEANKNSFNMNNELTKLRAKLSETEKKYEDTISQPDAKVDKMLIRNLIIGFITSNNNLSKDQHQILKIIGTVLDFTQQDNDKLQINKSLQSSWINSLLHPAHQNMSQESLSLAFVKFLENESKPMNLPSLLDNKTTENSTDKSEAQSSKPSLLNEMVLPTFNDYGQRSSSSILKDVLK